MHDELVDAIASEPCDFVYGGTTGALAAVAAGAGRHGARFGLDLEDFHSGEQSGPGSELAHGLAERIEADVLPHAAFLTAGSPMIAEAYHAKYGVQANKEAAVDIEPVIEPVTPKDNKPVEEKRRVPLKKKP